MSEMIRQKTGRTWPLRDVPRLQWVVQAEADVDASAVRRVRDYVFSIGRGPTADEATISYLNQVCAGASLSSVFRLIVHTFSSS